MTKEQDEIDYPCEMTDSQKEVYATLIETNEQEAVDAYISLQGEEYIDESLENFEEAYAGQFDSDEEFAQDTATNLGSIDRNLEWPHTCINWEWAARELMMDYSEENGFYFLSL